MKPLEQALIWGIANGVMYGLGAFSMYGNSIPKDAPERWLYGAVAGAVALAAATFGAWYVIEPRQDRRIRAWRLGGIVSCVAAAVAFIPVLYWITANSYVWYMRLHPEAADNTVMTFFGGVLSLPVIVVTVFLVVFAISEGVRRLARRGPRGAVA